MIVWNFCILIINSVPKINEILGGKNNITRTLMSFALCDKPVYLMRQNSCLSHAISEILGNRNRKKSLSPELKSFIRADSNPAYSSWICIFVEMGKIANKNRQFMLWPLIIHPTQTITWFSCIWCDAVSQFFLVFLAWNSDYIDLMGHIP